MSIDDLRSRVFELLLAHRQNRVLVECADDDQLVLEEKLREAEEGITYWLIDAEIDQARKRFDIGMHVLSTYGAEWSGVENGSDYVAQIARNVELHSSVMALTAQMDIV